jgi:hypothetical protein
MRTGLFGFILVASALVLIAPSGAQQVFQALRGSELRTQLLDAVRPAFEKETNGSIEFVVRRLNVLENWAFGEVGLQRPGGGQINWRNTKYAADFAAGAFDPGGAFFLLRRRASIWEVMEFSTGPTDLV